MPLVSNSGERGVASMLASHPIVSSTFLVVGGMAIGALIQKKLTDAEIQAPEGTENTTGKTIPVRKPKNVHEHQSVIKLIPVADVLRGNEKQAPRARPNKRLETVFGIANAFTTTDSGKSADFVEEAGQRIRKAFHLAERDKFKKNVEGDWEDMKSPAGKAVREFLASKTNPGCGWLTWYGWSP